MAGVYNFKLPDCLKFKLNETNIGGYTSMKPFIRSLLFTLFLAIPLAAQAENSMLRIMCEGEDVGAEVSINGKFKGECPIDMAVAPGKLQLRVVKNIDASNEGVYEQEIRMGDGVVKKIEIVLSPRSKAQEIEDKRLAAEAAKADNAAKAAKAAEAREAAKAAKAAKVAEAREAANAIKAAKAAEAAAVAAEASRQLQEKQVRNEAYEKALAKYNYDLEKYNEEQRTPLGSLLKECLVVCKGKGFLERLLGERNACIRECYAMAKYEMDNKLSKPIAPARPYEENEGIAAKKDEDIPKVRRQQQISEK